MMAKQMYKSMLEEQVDSFGTPATPPTRPETPAEPRSDSSGSHIERKPAEPSTPPAAAQTAGKVRGRPAKRVSEHKVTVYFSEEEYESVHIAAVLSKENDSEYIRKNIMSVVSRKSSDINRLRNMIDNPD